MILGAGALSYERGTPVRGAHPVLSGVHHPEGNPRENPKSISHGCYLREVAFEWELTKETIYLPLGCLQGGGRLTLYFRQVEFLEERLSFGVT